MILYEKLVEVQCPRLWGFFKRRERPTAFVISNIYLFLKESCKYMGASTSGVASLSKIYRGFLYVEEHKIHPADLNSKYRSSENDFFF